MTRPIAFNQINGLTLPFQATVDRVVCPKDWSRAGRPSAVDWGTQDGGVWAGDASAWPLSLALGLTLVTVQGSDAFCVARALASMSQYACSHWLTWPAATTARRTPQIQFHRPGSVAGSLRLRSQAMT